MGSPYNWRLDAGAEPQMVEIKDRHDLALNPPPETRAGGRAGENRSMYLSRKDFTNYGYTDGCTGCRDLASGKKRAGSFLSSDNLACRKRVDAAIKALE